MKLEEPVLTVNGGVSLISVNLQEKLPFVWLVLALYNPEVLNVFMKVCRGVHYIHKKRLVQSNSLKPYQCRKKFHIKINKCPCSKSHLMTFSFHA